MKDFIYAGIIGIITNIYFVAPFWDVLKTHWLSQGYTNAQISVPYYLLCGASYIAVGLVFYGLIKLIKCLGSRF